MDDRPDNLLALESVLAPLGQELVKARSGAEALKHVLQDDFAVILLDVQMPGMDGFETARMIRERERSRTTPIIFLTAISKEEEHVSAGYETGAVDYVVKPFRPEILRAKVAVFIELARHAELVRRQAELLEQRSRELERANGDLRGEIIERMRAEAALARYAEELARANSELSELAQRREAARKELESLYGRTRELEQMKSQFFANVSHELRTPLALILGPVTQKLLAGSALPAEQQRWLEVVEQNARVLLKHVNDLLDVAKLEAGRMDLHYCDTDLARILRVAASYFEHVAQDRRVTFIVDTPETLPAQVDSEKISRVITNLLSNAFRFVPDGGQVSCGIRSENSRAEITISDSGPGVPAEIRGKIFERFRRSDAGASTPGGAGLGLAIVKEFIEMHGGSVSVGDAPEGGALFGVNLPIVAPPNARVAAEHEIAGTQQAGSDVVGIKQFRTFQPHRGSSDRNDALALVVEDNAVMNAFITRTLAAHYRTDSAFDGQEGLEKALQLKPDVILVDIMMPKMDGEQLVREIRAHRSLDSTPIIIITAKADDDLRIHLLSHGAQDYLVKPFSPEELHARIANLVTVKRVRDALQREVFSQERDVVVMVKELLATKQKLEQALADPKLA